MNKIILAILLITFSTSVICQNLTKQEKIEQIKSQKVAFITDKLSLTPEEAQQFWPVYNEFFKRKEMINVEKKKITNDLRENYKTFSDDRKVELVDKLVALKLREANIEQQYYDKLKTILSIDKVIKLYNAENQFKNYLIKQIRANGNAGINQSSRESRRK